MLRKLIITASILVIPAYLPGQSLNDSPVSAVPGNEKTEVSDSLKSLAPQPVTTTQEPAELSTYEQQVSQLNAAYRAMQLEKRYPNYQNLSRLRVEPFTPGLIASWGSGGIVGSTDMESMPGLMGKESGKIAIIQNVGRFSFTAYGAAEKYGYYGGLDRTVGFGGSVSYRASDRVGITLFGSYYSPLRSPQGAVAGYVSVPRIGGFVDYSFSEHWGVEVGAQSYRSSINGHWHTQPIVTPYYRINKHTKIGMDVGGILYNLLYRQTEKSSRRANPTIPIPKMGTLPVGSRD